MRQIHDTIGARSLSDDELAACERFAYRMAAVGSPAEAAWLLGMLSVMRNTRRAWVKWTYREAHVIAGSLPDARETTVAGLRAARERLDRREIILVERGSHNEGNAYAFNLPGKKEGDADRASDDVAQACEEQHAQL